MSNTARMRRAPFFSRAVAGLVLFALAAACDSPTGPSQNRPEPPTQNQPEPNRIDFSGTYTLTLSASSRCALELPEAMRIRTYTATIAQGGGSLVVTVHSQYPGWNNGRFAGEFGETNDVIFQLALEDWWVDGGAEYHASGRMTATIAEEGLSGPLDGVMEGSVTNEDGRGYRFVKCTAPDHGAVFSR